MGGTFWIVIPLTGGERRLGRAWAISTRYSCTSRGKDSSPGILLTARARGTRFRNSGTWSLAATRRLAESTSTSLRTRAAATFDSVPRLEAVAEAVVIRSSVRSDLAPSYLRLSRDRMDGSCHCHCYLLINLSVDL